MKTKQIVSVNQGKWQELTVFFHSPDYYHTLHNMVECTIKSVMQSVLKETFHSKSVQHCALLFDVHYIPGPFALNKWCLLPIVLIGKKGASLLADLLDVTSITNSVRIKLSGLV